MNNKGIFITFDGQHGAGKTFLVDSLCLALEELGYPVYKTKEPTTSEIGSLARKSEQNFTAETLVCLFAADRFQHCRSIAAELEKGSIVLCDRYLISSLILQNMDGVEFNYTNQVNGNILRADFSVVLYADRFIINNRLLARDKSRLALIEAAENFDRYLYYRQKIEDFCENVFYFRNNDHDDLNKIKALIIDQITGNRGDRL
jgi:dTMP kinase